MKKHTHHRKAPLCLLAGSGLLFSLFVPGYSQGTPGGAAAKPSTVLVQKAAAIDSAVNKKYIGQVEAIDRVTVQPRVSGNIVATRFREGKVVKKGDLLFEIEDTRYRAAVEEAIAKKAQLEAKLLYAKTVLNAITGCWPPNPSPWTRWKTPRAPCMPWKRKSSPQTPPLR